MEMSQDPKCVPGRDIAIVTAALGTQAGSFQCQALLPQPSPEAKSSLQAPLALK